jgi:hypothetical protein
MEMSFKIIDRGNGITWVQVDQDICQLAVWCQQTGCGKQVNWKHLSFKNPAELTMFLLKWQDLHRE